MARQINEFIRKVDGGYVVVSHKGKRLSKPASKEAAIHRLKQIEFFKHQHEAVPVNINTNFNSLVELSVGAGLHSNYKLKQRHDIPTDIQARMARKSTKYRSWKWAEIGNRPPKHVTFVSKE